MAKIPGHLRAAAKLHRKMFKLEEFAPKPKSMEIKTPEGVPEGSMRIFPLVKEAPTKTVQRFPGMGGREGKKVRFAWANNLLGRIRGRRAIP